MGFFLTEEKLRRAIAYCFHILFLITPLLVSIHSYELFEYPKMMFVYAMTIIIVTLWLLRMIAARSLVYARTPLDIPILVYLGAIVVTTITSIDRHLSIFGYYSRFNGGLLSWLCYSLLYFAFVANVRTQASSVQRLASSKGRVDSGQARMTDQELQPTTYNLQPLLPFLRTILISGSIVALYAILERLGIDNHYWQEDVQARVFSSFGQPNWLAGYLGMLVPLSVGMFLTAKTKARQAVYCLLFIVLYAAFTFTYSRGGFVGLAVGLFVFGLLLIPYLWHHKREALAIVVIPIVVFVLFGNAFTRDTGYKGIINERYPPYTTPAATKGTESGVIRKIVWQGAWQVFIHHPIFGTGNETFANAYYWYRPVAHNQTSEWDLLYNKAHNEYLDALATKGVVGFIPYLVMLGAMVVVPLISIGYFPFSIFHLPFKRKATKISFLNFNGKWKLENGKSSSTDQYRQNEQKVLTVGLLAAIISYLVQNFFGFSVVFINVLLYLFAAFLVVLINQVHGRQKALAVLRKRISRSVALAATLLLLVTSSYFIGSMWLADLAFARGYHLVYSGYPARAYQNFASAKTFFPYEPFYQVYFGFAAAHTAVIAHDKEEATLAADLTQDATTALAKAQAQAPNNLYNLRLVTRGYQQLMQLGDTFDHQALAVAQFVVDHSPTDPQDRLRLAEVLAANSQLTQAKATFLTTIDLKSDWSDASIKYGNFLLDHLDNHDLVSADDLKTATNHLAPFLDDTEALSLFASLSANVKSD